MKKVIGILGIIVISMVLGFSIEWAEKEGITLKSAIPAAITFEGE